MTARHKVFVSYHHLNDQNYKNIFELRFGNSYDVLVPSSVGSGDIDTRLPTETIRQKIRDEFLADSSVTVVLIGSETWQRKHIDWEIASSIRDTKNNPRSGLLGIFLPSYGFVNGRNYNPRTIPPRLNANVANGFASLHYWTEDPAAIQRWIHEAYLRKSSVIPDNSYPAFANNRSGSQWT
jgi:hypothetical protein